MHLSTLALYWSERTTDPLGWFYKTQEEWTDEVCLTRYEQEGARKILRTLGFWYEERRGVPAKLYFRLDLDSLTAAIAQYAETQQTSRCKTHPQARKNSTDKAAENQHASSQKTREHKEQRLPETTVETTQREVRTEGAHTLSLPSLSSRRRSSEIPEGFTPNEQHYKLAAELGVDLPRSFAAFVDYHAARGTRFVDWNRALNTWLRNEQRLTGENTKGREFRNRALERQSDNVAAAGEALTILQRRMAN